MELGELLLNVDMVSTYSRSLGGVERVERGASLDRTHLQHYNLVP